MAKSSQYLIDTHIYLHWLDNRQIIKPAARHIIESREHTIFLSAAVTWEIAVKTAIGKLHSPQNPLVFMEDSQFLPLSITHQHALEVANLPLIHRDPFDRIQLAQAKCDGLTFITADKTILSYPHIAMLEG